jgi:hypothetical protein
MASSSGTPKGDVRDRAGESDPRKNQKNVFGKIGPGQGKKRCWEKTPYPHRPCPKNKKNVFGKRVQAESFSSVPQRVYPHRMNTWPDFVYRISQKSNKLCLRLEKSAMKQRCLSRLGFTRERKGTVECDEKWKPPPIPRVYKTIVHAIWTVVTSRITFVRE